MNKFAGQFLLPQIYACIMWLEGLISLLEELISVVSVPLLSFGVSMSMIDFFVAGQLSKNPQFTLSWSIIQAVSIDAQIAYTWHKARRAWHQKKFLPFLGFLLVGLTLAFVVWGASSLEGLDHATGAGTLAAFGLTPQILVGIRMAVAVILLCIAGWTRRLIAELDDVPTRADQITTSEQTSLRTLIGQKMSSIRLFKKKDLVSSPVSTPPQVIAVIAEDKETDTDPLLPVSKEQTGEQTPKRRITVKLSEQTTEQFSGQSSLIEEDKTVDKPVRHQKTNVSSINRGGTAQKMRRMLKKNPQIPVADLMAKTGASRSYASEVRTQFLNEQSA